MTRLGIKDATYQRHRGYECVLPKRHTLCLYSGTSTRTEKSERDVMSSAPQLRFGTNKAAVHVKSLGTPGDALKTSELALITLEGFSVDMAGLYSKDPGRRGREGTLVISINGQPTSLSWAEGPSQLKNHEKFQNAVLYLGGHTSGVDLDVRVIEHDEDAKKRLERVSGALSVIARYAGQVPVHGTAVAAGAALGAGITDTIIELIGPELELSYSGALRPSKDDDPSHELRTGEYTIVRPSRDETSNTTDEPKHDISIKLKVTPLPAPDKTPVAIEIAEIHGDLLRGIRGCDLFFESTFGSGKQQKTFSFRESLRQTIDRVGFDGSYPLEWVMNLAGKRVYHGPMGSGVPFSLTAAAVDDQEELKALGGLIDSTSQFVQTTTGEDPTDVTKAIQSARSTLIEFLPDKVGIGTRSGILWLGQPPQDLPKCFVPVALPATVDAGWGPKSDPIVLKSESGGKIDVFLRARRLALPS